MSAAAASAACRGFAPSWAATGVQVRDATSAARSFYPPLPFPATEEDWDRPSTCP